MDPSSKVPIIHERRTYYAAGKGQVCIDAIFDDKIYRNEKQSARHSSLPAKKQNIWHLGQLWRKVIPVIRHKQERTWEKAIHAITKHEK
jgi:hypothetical protein